MEQPFKLSPYFEFKGGFRWILFLPIISLVAVIAEISFKTIVGKDPFFDIDQNFNKFVINVFLLNSLHLIFPFMVLLLLPPGRELFLKKKTQWIQRWWIGASAVAIVVSLFIVSLQSIKNLEFISPIKPFLTEAMIWVWYLVPTFHGMRQSAGVSQLLNDPSRAQNIDQQKAKLKERRLLVFYYFAVIGAFVTQRIVSASASQWIWFMSSVALALAVAIIFNSRKLCVAGNNDKFIFSFRFLLWPLQPFSQIVFWSVVFNHGIEYVALIAHMLNVTTQKISRRLYLASPIVLGMMMISFYNFFDLFYQEYPAWVDESWMFCIFLAVYPFLTLLHYVVDAVLYRMSDPDVQSTMGRFFAPMSSVRSIKRSA